VVIEHDTKFIFGLCDTVSVLVQGEVLVEGTPDTVRDDPRVIEAYLGKPREEVEAAVSEAAASGHVIEHGTPDPGEETDR
jgi:branched-chain amino acid transport system ATP-binding protein